MSNLNPIYALILLFVVGCADTNQPTDLSLELIVNPSGRVPLAAVVQFSSQKNFNATLEVTDGENPRSVEIETSPNNGVHSIPVIGMRPGKNHKIALTLHSNGQEILKSEFKHTTPSLPTDQTEFPTIEIKTAKAELMEPGITFLSLRRRILGQGINFTDIQRRWFKNWGKVFAINNHGEVVWWFESDFCVAGIEPTNEGTLLIQRVTASTLEIDMLGNVLTEYYAEKTVDKPTAEDAVLIKDVEVMHHQPHQMATGDFLAFSAYATVFENWYSSETDPDAPRADIPMVVDKLIQYDREGNVKWSWDVMDYLRNDRFGQTTFWNFWNRRGFPKHMDWSHGNGLSYYAPDDAVLAAFRNFSAILKIDRKSGDIQWLLGRHDGWSEYIQDKLLTPVGDLMWPGYSHNPRMIDIGTVIMFDNRAHGGPVLAFEETTPIPERFSRAVEFKVDQENMTVEQIWTSGDTAGEDPCYSDAMGDAYRLPETGNRLVVFAFCSRLDPKAFKYEGRNWNDYVYGGRIFEYDGAEQVFRADVYDRDHLFQWEVYGGFRSPGFYEGSK